MADIVYIAGMGLILAMLQYKKWRTYSGSIAAFVLGTTIILCKGVYYYDPINGTWTSISQTNAPAPRYLHKTAVVNNKLIIWGGHNGSMYMADGGIYDPVTDVWTPISTVRAPSGRIIRFSIVVYDNFVMIFGGDDIGGASSSGGIYDVN